MLIDAHIFDSTDDRKHKISLAHYMLKECLFYKLQKQFKPLSDTNSLSVIKKTGILRKSLNSKATISVQFLSRLRIFQMRRPHFLLFVVTQTL